MADNKKVNIYQLQKSSVAAVFLVLILSVSSCDFYYKNMPFVPIPPQTISGPVEIGSDWIEIVPPEPLRPIVNYQWINLGFYKENEGNFTDNSEKGVSLILEDGRRTIIEAVLFDNKGESYELHIVGRGSGIMLRRKIIDKIIDGKPVYGSLNFPSDRIYTKLKIRSEIPITCDKIEWINSKAQ